MADAAGKGSRVGERRRQRALNAFRKELDALDADEIQARLDANRIRSAERQAMARQRLRLLRSGEATPDADEREDRRDDGVEQDIAEDSGAQQDDEDAMPLARRIGRLVGMTAAVGGVVLAGAWLIRR